MGTQTTDAGVTAPAPLTEQQIFDRVWQHFIVLGNPRAVDEGTTDCSYRTEDGRRYAIGLFIPDRLYKAEMEARGVWVLTQEYPQLLQVFAGVSRTFLAGLQSAHDLGYTLEKFSSKLRIVADEFGLTIPEGSAAQ